MSRTALVSGSPDRVAGVASALAEAGFVVIPVDDPDRLAAECEKLGQGSIDAYVQLPVDVPPGEGPVVERVRQFLTSGLLRRFEAVAAVLPCLNPGAVVVLAAGQRPGFEGAPDDRHARLELLRVLARAILAEHRERDVRAVIMGAQRSPADIARAALRRTAPTAEAAGYAAADPELTYDDWAREVLALTEGD